MKTYISMLVQGLYFKLRRLVPCSLSHMDFDVDLPKDEIQVQRNVFLA